MTVIRSVNERVKELREYLKQKGLYGFIVPTDDPHMSEYPPDHFKRREYISGFTGSAGVVLVTLDHALLWTDGRYHLQAAQQLDKDWTVMKVGLLDTPTIEAYIANSAPKNSKIGLDPYTYTASAEKLLRSSISIAEIDLEFTENLVDKVWSKDQPSLPLDTVRIHPVEYAGATVGQKLEDARKALKLAQAEHLIVTLLDDVAYLYNLRGNDIEYNPVFVAYASVSFDDAVLYINEKKVEGKITSYLKENKVTVKCYQAIQDDVRQLGKEGKRIWMDPEKVSVALHNIYKKAFQDEKKCNKLTVERNVVKNPSPIMLIKSIKNDVELEGMRQAHKLDGVALCNAFCEIENLINDGNQLSELQIDEICTSYRKKQIGFVELSFPTIAGEGPNGAIIHYRATEKSARVATKDSILLVDSGAQFECGTTDITRTFHFGEPTAQQKEAYTLVLKGNINLAMVIFPEGTLGLQVDALARKALWEKGLNYLHGTGHGVGAALNVHEGPHSISTRLVTYPLQGGMIVSNEPGYYESGQFGIRIENLLIINPVKTKHNFNGFQFYGFETLTQVPIQTKMVDSSLLTQQEKDYLNGYHTHVFDLISPQVDERTRIWLKENTKPIV